jgi:hypothetical protein
VFRPETQQIVLAVYETYMYNEGHIIIIHSGENACKPQSTEPKLTAEPLPAYTAVRF